jgi:hypothetical protein
LGEAASLWVPSEQRRTDTADVLVIGALIAQVVLVTLAPFSRLVVDVGEAKIAESKRIVEEAGTRVKAISAELSEALPELRRLHQAGPKESDAEFVRKVAELVETAEGQSSTQGEACRRAGCGSPKPR